MSVLDFAKYFKRKNPAKEISQRVIYAVKGEIITCENGHEIAEFVDTVYRGDLQNVEVQISNWRQEKPIVGQHPLPVCAQCKADFTSGITFHIGNNWRV